MILIRIAGFLAPQILISLLKLAEKDLLGGWNQTDDAMGTVMALFFFGPVIIAFVLISDSIHVVTWRKDPARKLPIWLPFLGLIFFAESLAIDFYLLTQLRM